MEPLHEARQTTLFLLLSLNNNINSMECLKVPEIPSNFRNSVKAQSMWACIYFGYNGTEELSAFALADVRH